MSIYKANKTMQLIGKQIPGRYMTDTEIHKGFTDILTVHQEAAKHSLYDIALDMLIYGIITGKREERKKRQEKNINILSMVEDAAILDADEIGELATTWKVPQDLFEVCTKALHDAMEDEPQTAEKLTNFDKMHYMCDEAYKRGILTAIYMLNETNKDVLAMIKAEVIERI